MSERRAPRLIVEVAFLTALSAALTFADVQTYAIVAVMAAGWVIAGVFEWGALRSRPHYGSGLPPRWYLPRVTLPPPRPLEQFASGYPAADAAADAPTWIASPAMLAEWPVADVEAPDEAPPEEQTHEHDVLEAELAAALAEESQAAVPAVADEEPEDEEPEPEPRREPLPLPPGTRMARHRIDPLAQPPAKSRRFGRRGEQAGFDAEVPDRPLRRRLLPAQSRGE